MKLAGFLLLVAGWAIVVSALVLLPSAGPRTAFALAGMAVELLGLALAVRSHLVLEAEGELPFWRLLLWSLCRKSPRCSAFSSSFWYRSRASGWR